MALLSFVLLIIMCGTLTMSLHHSPFKPPRAFRSVSMTPRLMPRTVFSQNQTGRPMRKREIILQWLDAVFHFIDGMV